MTSHDPQIPAPDNGPTADTATPVTRVDVADAPNRTAGRDDERASEGGSRWRFLGSMPVLVLLALAIAIVIKSFLVQAFFIPSESMEPTLFRGDRVLVNKLAYATGDVGRHDVIVFVNPNGDDPPDRGVVGGVLHWLGEGIGVAQPENEDYIKRAIGLPGETVEIHDRTVFIDGDAIEEPYLTGDARSCNRDFGPVTVPEDSLFVMGDNRCNSADSRFGLGFVPATEVVGRAVVVIWPPSDMGGLG
ncbi:MAG TPA: signal peptidase I [Actinomycetota bacterium]|nr:signal peptidase I [Actinomycetota bacterium]